MIARSSLLLQVKAIGIILSKTLLFGGIFLTGMKKAIKGKLQEVERKLLEGVGEPEEKGFVPSPFQLKAVEELQRGSDVIVVAPTGSGKTWIALQAIEQYLSEGKVTWYTTPLKALSNQKYDDFRGLFGEQHVGLLTGERRENPSAPIIVATTEVLRNALYGSSAPPDFVVLDEAHYLGDEDRGTTWEEVVILSPKETQLLLLSATISNVRELSGWIGEVRGKTPKVIKAQGRPVPLRYAFLGDKGVLLPLEVEYLKAVGPYRKKGGPEKVLELLEGKGLLPAIWFLPKRRQCDLMAKRFAHIPWPREQERMEIYREVVRDDPHLWSHPLLDALLIGGVASHHAGHLTKWKVAVERMLSRGLLRAVFATTTLAAGLDVPARTVLMSSLSTGDGRKLTVLEFHQMAGRAGRRGKDKVGFVVMVGMGPKECLYALRLSLEEPEPLNSSFRLHYHQILNLLDKYSPEETESFLDRSFLLYQIRGKRRKKVRGLLLKGLKKRLSLLEELGYLGEDHRVSEDLRWVLMLRHEHSLVISELIRRGYYKGVGPSTFAAWIGSLAGERAPRRAIGKVDLGAMRKVVWELEALEHKWGIVPLGLKASYQGQRGTTEAEKRASVLKAWAEGMEWRELVELAQMEEGDLQRLILQTAELLREIEDLGLEVSELAAEARSLLLRPPVWDWF